MVKELEKRNLWVKVERNKNFQLGGMDIEGMT